MTERTAAAVVMTARREETKTFAQCHTISSLLAVFPLICQGRNNTQVYYLLSPTQQYQAGNLYLDEDHAWEYKGQWEERKGSKQVHKVPHEGEHGCYKCVQ